MRIQCYLAGLLIVITLMTACTKEDKTDEPNTEINCRLSKIFLYKGSNNARIIDTLVYTYTDTNVTKLTGAEGYLTFEYSGARITRCNYFDSLATIASTSYKTATYNSDGTVSTIEVYGKGSAELKDRYEFAYNAGRLTKLTCISLQHGVPDGNTGTHFYTYTGNNITRDSVVETESNLTEHAVYYYTYDAEENYFGKDGTNALFNSAFAIDFDADALPFLFSANNVTGFREDPNGAFAQFSYATNTKGDPKLMKIFDVPLFAWEYNCP